MTIVEFLEARIAEDEREANVCLAQYRRGEGGSSPRWKRQLAECSAKRAIIEQHGEWPVLVERAPSGDFDANDTQSMTYRMVKEIAWLTEREYVKRFGVEPPTTPMLRALAAVYSTHPDYQQEWAL
jgi:hypothetical protein